jgi:hypothetical protein
MSNIVIDIAAEFTGNKAFKQAETSTEKLTKNVKKLAAAVGLGFGTAQILAFGKASVKAALEAQSQQERLANLVKVTVGATDAQVQALNEQATALEKIGVVSAGNITQTQSQLATFNLQIDTIKQLTPAILDYVTAEKGAAASASEFKSMTNGLAQALNGNFASLTKVGFVLDEVTKKTIKEGTETERAAALVKVLNSTYQDFNKNLANTPTGQMQKLGNAADDVKVIIGTGLLDALKSIGEDTSVETLADNMQAVALYVADVTRGIGKLTSALKNIPIIGSLNVGMIPILGTYLEILRATGKQAPIQKASDNAHLKSLQNQFAIIKKTSVIKTKMTAAEIAALKAAKLKQAIEKGNLALLKGEEIFDMDKIQIAAALTGQAEALGKATNAAQVLAITQDVARLNVKQSILALDDAIAAKDEAAIVAATKKLNADLGILGALSGQSVKISDIKSILDSLKPKDLIDQANLDQALAKIRQMLNLLGSMSGTINLGVGGGTGLVGGGTGLVGGGTGLVGGRSQAQIEQDERLQRLYQEELERRAAAERAAKAATDALANNNNKPFIPVDTGPIIDPINIRFTQVTDQELAAVQEFAEAAAERADAISILVDSITAGNAAILAANSAVGTVDVGLAARSSMLAGMVGGAGFASAVSGSRYAAQAQAQYNITVQAGVGDPNAIAEAIDNILREANARGTITSGILSIA